MAIATLNPGSNKGVDIYGRPVISNATGGVFLLDQYGNQTPWTPFNPGATPPASIAIPDVGAGSGIPSIKAPPPLTFDPLLSPTTILQQGQDALAAAKAPVDPSKFIVPGAMELMTKGVNEQLNINRASAQSDFMRRGMTGSSTEVGTLTKELPAAANLAIQEGTIKLLQSAYPLALADKQNIVDATFKTASLSSQVRQMIGDEQFKQLSLDQQREIANQDVQLKLKLAEVEMKFQAAMQQAQQAWQGAENEKDRAQAAAQFEYLKDQRKKASQGAFLSSLTTLAGIGIGLALAPATGGASMLMTSAAVGGMAGQAAGGGLSSLFLTD